MEFEELKDLFEKKLHTKICLNQPYKLCDYKPYYGYLFSEYLTGYDFWGYCDCDLIFGNIDAFLPEVLLRQNDKLLRTGHLSFIRNTDEINSNFLHYETYKMVISSPVIYGYDESINGYHQGFAGELIDHGYKFYRNDEMVADIDFRHLTFHIVSNPDNSCVLSYENGSVFKYSICNRELEKSEMAYVHLQKRKMKVNDAINENKYLIIPNEFINFNESLLDSQEFWDSVTSEESNYFDWKAERKNERRRTINRFWHEPNKLKSIMYRLKGN